MRRIASRRDERGATAVVVAILLTVLLGVGALAVDAGALWWDRKQLQNGADAAALSLAQSCATGDCEADEWSMAEDYARDNKNDDEVRVTDISHPSSAVRVEVATDREHWLAGVLGFGSSEVTAAATASWGGIGAAKVLPLTISMCADASYAVGTEIDVVVRDKKTEADICLGSAGHYAPGNWGWLKPTTTDCLVETRAGNWVFGDTGTGHPTGCEDQLRGLELEEAVLLPVFGDIRGTGANTEFSLTGYISLKVTSYCLSHNVPGMQANISDTTPACKSANDRWIRGSFIEFVDLGAELGGPDYGSTAVRLTD